jgi:hypothetical protein
MRTLAPAGVLALAVLSCGGPGTSPGGAPAVDHVVLSFLVPGSPEDRLAADYGRFRNAHSEIVRSSGPGGHRLLSDLRRLRPRFVTVFVPADRLDASFAWTFQDLAASVDPDPFTDFAYGFVPVADLALLQRWLQSLRVAEGRLDRRLIKSVQLETAAIADERVERLEWAGGLPRMRLDVVAGDRVRLLEVAHHLSGADLLLVSGPGGPEGVEGGLTAEDAGLLNLDGTVAFLGVPRSAAVGTTLEIAGGRIARRRVDPARSLAAALFRRGALAVFAPLDDDGPESARIELEAATLCSEPLGMVMKRTYDAVRAVRGAPWPPFQEGDSVPDEYAAAPRPFRAAARVLLGDPSIQPFVRETQPPVRFDGRSEQESTDGARIEVIRYTVTQADAAQAFLDPIGGGDRIHLRHPVSWGTDARVARLASVDAAGSPVQARLTGQAVEAWEGTRFLHVVIAAEAGALRRPDATLTLHVAPKP